MATQKTSFWLTPKGLAALGLIAAATYFYSSNIGSTSGSFYRS